MVGREAPLPSSLMTLCPVVLLFAMMIFAKWKSAEEKPPIFIPYLDALSTPEMNQSSIEKAIERFHIVVPEHADTPMFDASLGERGLTVRSPFSKGCQVSIGPSAFESWSLLGSTLAHEMEVHCRQNFMWLSLLEWLNPDAISIAEREAYLYELDQSHRFRLSAADQESIQTIIDQYYPETRKRSDFVDNQLQSFGVWLAKSLIERN